MNTSIPCHPSALRRNDVLRVRQGTTHEDYRVTGKKRLAVSYRVNTVSAAGKRRALYFCDEGSLEITHARRAVQLDPPPVIAPFLAYDDTPYEGFLLDSAGDLAYRSGVVGVWLRIDGRWTACPDLWRWSTEPRVWAPLHWSSDTGWSE